MSALTTVIMRAGLAALLATFAVLLEESRALAGVPTVELATGAGTMIAVALAAPLLLVMSAAFTRAPLARLHASVRLAAGIAVAIAAAVANQTFYPRLYPKLHLGLVAIALFGCTVAADAVLAAFAHATAVRTGSVSGLLALALFAIGSPAAARSLTDSPMTRTALHEKSELLRPIVRLAAEYHRVATTEVVEALDPLVAPPISLAAVAARHNVLLITVDALRADHVGAYGYERATTPNLDALARAGVVFKHAYTSAPQTSYALSSMMTGTHVRAVRAAPPTWAAQFAEQGYATAAFYPETIFYTERPRFSAFEATRFGFEHALVEHATAVTRSERVASFVEQIPEGRPFFAWTHVFEPHEPYDAHAEHPFGSADLDRYDAEIAYADRAIGVMVQNTLARHPRTIVIITADHGEAFGEHASRYHGTTLYEEQVRVPLIVHAPGVFAPETIDRPVQTIDLLPTVARLVGVSIAGPLRGRDLFIGGEGVAFASLAEHALLAVGAERLVCQAHIATCALFDLHDDPEQDRPTLSGPRVDELRASLAAAHAGNAAASH